MLGSVKSSGHYVGDITPHMESFDQPQAPRQAREAAVRPALRSLMPRPAPAARAEAEARADGLKVPVDQPRFRPLEGERPRRAPRLVSGAVPHARCKLHDLGAWAYSPRDPIWFLLLSHRRSFGGWSCGPCRCPASDVLLRGTAWSVMPRAARRSEHNEILRPSHCQPCTHMRE